MKFKLGTHLTDFLVIKFLPRPHGSPLKKGLGKMREKRELLAFHDGTEGLPGSQKRGLAQMRGARVKKKRFSI